MLNVLIVGGGGREHALAWKVTQSTRLQKLYLAPGNAGTRELGENLAVSVDDFDNLLNTARQNKVDLVLVGPEIPLAAGLADRLTGEGLAVFGPSQKAAQIEASKAIAKAFMQRHDIPTARFGTFDRYQQALNYLHKAEGPVVIKASGLAAGKGVLLPETPGEAEATLKAMLVEKQFGLASRQVVIEERLEGDEVSILAFTDGRNIKTMPPAQDHKRLLDDDAGPNTGGMGAYAPAPYYSPQWMDEIERTILQPTIDGLRAEGTPFVGVLYAGLMLTAQGPRVLEFNCRFGDPETQAILPLLETDLLDIAEACVQGRLDQIDVRWKEGAAACVVLASEGYPGKCPLGRPITGLDLPQPGAFVFHAGTACHENQVVTAGGRVLGITGWGSDLRSALQAAYQAVEHIHFEGMQFRRDIGHKGLVAVQGSAYRAAGVNIDAGSRAVDLMKAAVRSTYGPEVLAGIGAFGGLYDASAVKAIQHPVLVASTDGVGTKVRLAAQVGKYTSVGCDIVNHCINDILVQGARPLFFLDYIAMQNLDPAMVAEIVRGMANACREAGMALLGGETAEMPGVYAPGEFDVAGTIVGVVERDLALPRAGLGAGDVLLGLRSSGPHTNGYSLIRKVFRDVALETVYPALGIPLGEALLAPHRSYLPLLQPLVGDLATGVRALVHLTGGGFLENIPRVLPEGLGAVIHLGGWPIPPLFKLIQEMGNISTEEMYRVFNMGIGMVIIAEAGSVPTIQHAIPEGTWVIGELVKGEGKVRLV